MSENIQAPGPFILAWARYNQGMMTRSNRSLTPWLLAGDWLVLLLFVFIGQRDHGMNVIGSVPSLLMTTLAVALPWTVAAWLLGALRSLAGAAWQAWLGRALAAWLIAAPLGLILRALLRGQASIPVPFMLVMIGLGGLFVLGWRALVYWWAGRRARGVPAIKT
jgi:hypothetical protein